MSAIAGVVYRDGRHADAAELSRMLDSMAFRGPEGRRAWASGPVALGHLRLSTTGDLERAATASASSSDLTITADVRLDNRRELIADLGVADLSDSQLILSAYERWGESCAARLLGDFAFAIWDGRTQSVYCARDHLGVKPFFYHLAAGAFLFGSQIRALLAAPMPRQLNESRIADYLVPIFEDQQATFYRGILRLPAAHALTVSRDGVRLERYWRLDPDHEIGYRDERDYADRFQEIFTDAVRCRLRDVSAAGSMLSGGLDSSSIVCVARGLMQESGGPPLQTFSAVFDDVPECDERRYIAAVLEGGGIEPHFVPAGAISPLADADRMFDHEDEAFFAPNLFMHWALYRCASRRGVRVLLDGIDGDTTVSHSLLLLAELARAGRLRLLARELNAVSRRWRRPRWRLLLRHVVWPNTPEGLKHIRRAGRRRSPLANGGIVRPEFARRIGLDDRLAQLLAGRLTSARTAREDHWRRLTSGLVPFSLEVADRAAAAFGIEPRYPFFDKRLVEYCLALPATQKLGGGWTRLVLRRAMTGILPEAVQWRGSKTDLSPLVHRGLLRFETPRLEATMADRDGVLGEYVNMRALRRAYVEYCRVGTDKHMEVWRAVTLGVWLARERSAVEEWKTDVRKAP